MEIMDNPQFFWCPTTETVRTDLLIIPPNKISILAILEKEAKDEDKVQIFLFLEKTVQFFWNLTYADSIPKPTPIFSIIIIVTCLGSNRMWKKAKNTHPNYPRLN